MSLFTSLPRRTRSTARHDSTRFVVCLAACLCAASVAAADLPPRVASRGDAFIAHQNGSDVWVIGSATLQLTIGFDTSRTLAVQRLYNPATDRTWDITPGADLTLTAGSERLTLTTSGAVTLLGVNAQTTEHGVMLTFTFEHRAQRLQFARVYACYPGSPTIETWTRVTSTGGDGTSIGDLVGWQMTMPLGRMRWLFGLRGDTAGDNPAAEGPFVLAERDLEPGERIEIGSPGRSSEQFVPLVFVDDGRDEFYGGLMWSGAWRAALERVDDRLRVGLSFPGVVVPVTTARALEVPHTFFGVISHASVDEAGALRPFIMEGIRHGRPFQPLVTYNTWFIYGTWMTEEQMVAEIDRAAALGVELFVMDAGWYVGAADSDQFDFEPGLGSWAEDGDRFPSGLASLADYAHGLGLKFGLWVEPERIALAQVDKPGLAREAWLASIAGSYGSTSTAQICLVRPEARQWVLDQLVALVERVHPDYLKWDNNFWINCSRAGHGHGPADGNLAHVQALYGLLDELRRRYPDLLIENVSGGGTRLDFGMLGYTDTAWMDERTAPSSYVRHNLEGLTSIFPPGYLLSLLIDADGEPIAGAEDLPLLTRSRSPGIFGLTYRSDLLDEETAALLAAQIAQYKSYRDLIAGSNASLLTAQAPVDENGWDVLQELSNDGRDALIFAFKGGPQDGRLIVRPRGLLAETEYDVTSLDVGPLGSSRGDLLMLDGLELVHTGGSRAHILRLTARD